jgi:hypothetical protein
VAGGAKLRVAIYHARTGAEVLAQVDAFFTAQLAAGAESGAEPDPEDASADFPIDITVCD